MNTILIVDDHEENIYLLQTLLKSYELNVSLARNGAEALELAQSEPPDIVVSDILMPVMDGFSLCRAWKNNDRLNHVPFVFYTATYTEPEDRAFALSLGADGFIAKGTNPDEFLREFDGLLRKFSSPNITARQVHATDETAYYRMYNEVLIHKLENKLIELEQANHSLGLSEANYKFLFENNPVPMWIYDLETLRFLTVNDAAIHKYGYPRDEFLSMALQDIRPAEDVAMLIENVETQEEGYQQSGPWRHRLKNSQIIDVEITSHNIHYAGRPARFVMAQDITERTRAEERLRESEERLRLALSAAKQGMYDLNILTGEAIVNDFYASMLGYDPHAFVETNDKWLERLHPEERATIEKTFQDYIHGRIPEYHVEFRQQTASGGWKWILSIGSIVERDQRGHPLRMLGTHTDITEIKNAEFQMANLLRESQRRLQRIAALRKIDIAISSNLQIEKTLDVVLTLIQEELNVDAAAMALYDTHRTAFRYMATIGIHTVKINDERLMEARSLARLAAQSKETVHTQSFDGFDLDPLIAMMFEKEGFQDYIGIPLKAKGEIIGVCELFHRTLLTPDEEWLGFCETLAGQAAVAIENAQLIEGLQYANEDLIHAYDATIEGWSKAMDLRDKETEGHTLRVTEMTLALARKLGIPEDEIIHIRRGALLHDIGKMGIPDSILLKPDILSEEEFRLMKEHPKYAYEMLRSIDYLRPALAIPHLHHEKWDGSGYPHGLKGEEIPLAARLFAIVDVYDALTSDRPYRAAWSKQDTLAYIAQQSEKHFDPRVVEVFLETVRD